MAQVVRLKDTSQSTACPKTRLQALAATELKAPGSCNSSNVPLGDSDDCTQTVANGHIVGSTIRLTHHRIALIHHNLLHGTPTIVGLPGGQTVPSPNYARPTTIATTPAYNNYAGFASPLLPWNLRRYLYLPGNGTRLEVHVMTKTNL